MNKIRTTNIYYTQNKWAPTLYRMCSQLNANTALLTQFSLSIRSQWPAHWNVMREVADVEVYENVWQHMWMSGYIWSACPTLVHLWRQFYSVINFPLCCWLRYLFRFHIVRPWIHLRVSVSLSCDLKHANIPKPLKMNWPISCYFPLHWVAIFPDGK